MKICKDCGKQKTKDKFYGVQGECKECTKKRVKKRYFSPEARAKIIAYEKERSQRPERKKQQAERLKRFRTKHKGKNRCRTKVMTELRAGRLTKLPCHCGETKVEAHHTDYRKPLMITWLCRKHHLLSEGKIPF